MLYATFVKILHVISSFDLAHGGPPRIALRLAAGAAAQGHCVTIAAYSAPEQAEPAIVEDRKSVPGADLVQRIEFAAPTRFERALGFRARRELDRIVPEFDIVHTHDVWSGISRHAMSLAVKHGVGFVLLPNGMLDPWSLQQKKLKKKLMLASGYRRTLNRALFIHTGNLDEKRGVEQMGLSAPIEIIPNGIYPQEFDPLPAPGLFFAAQPALAGKRFILFLSRLHYKKGLDYLAAAFIAIAPKHPDVHLVVAGPEEGAGDEFRQTIRDAGLADRVHVVGPTFSKDRFNSMIDSACFCLPSRQEGFSIAILEAMACGKPVVISTACHFPEVGTEGAGEVVTLEAPKVAGALDKLLSNPDLARQMGETGRRLVMERFTWPRVSQVLTDAYEKYLSEKPNRVRIASSKK